MPDHESEPRAFIADLTLADLAVETHSDGIELWPRDPETNAYSECSAYLDHADVVRLHAYLAGWLAVRPRGRQNERKARMSGRKPDIMDVAPEFRGGHINATRLCEYLDDAIRNWRAWRDDPRANRPEDRDMARFYIDAFQSVRTTVFGETLPDPDAPDPDAPENRAARRIREFAAKLSEEVRKARLVRAGMERDVDSVSPSPVTFDDLPEGERQNWLDVAAVALKLRDAEGE